MGAAYRPWARVPGEPRNRRAQAVVAAIRRGLDLGLTHIDTAEMYGSGAAESLIGRGNRGPARRGLSGLQGAAEQCLETAHTRSMREVAGAPAHRPARLLPASLARQSSRWRKRIAAFDTLVRGGKILSWGVSNFDVADLDEVGRHRRRRSSGVQPGAVPPRGARDRACGAALVQATRHRAWSPTRPSANRRRPSMREPASGRVLEDIADEPRSDRAPGRSALPAAPSGGVRHSQGIRASPTSRTMPAPMASI